MATNLSAPVTEDIWHLSIDDLLSPLPEKPRLGGPGPFVINLSSSTAGIGLPSLNLAGCESAHAYEIQRNEDGRTRYRLRLGPFETEEEADLILSVVREIYPSALTATAGPDDLRSIAAIRAKAAAAADARRPPAPPKQPEPPVVFSQADPINAALKAVASRPSAAIAPQPQAAPAASSALEALTLSVELSIAEILPPRRPQAPVSVHNAAPKVVEPPLVTERVEFTSVKKVIAPALPATASPPATPSVVAPIAPPVEKKSAAVAASSSAPAAAAYVAPAAPSLPKQPASIWEPPPVAPRSVASKFAPPAARPAMSVSAPLIRRAAAPAAAASAVKAAAPAMAAAKPSTAQSTSATTLAKSPVAPKPAAAAAAAAAAATAPAVVAAQKSQPAQRVAVPVEKHLDFDSTQTMRALTPKELSDENALPWFVIELTTSTEAFDPDTVPNLDIFAEYRLYSVAETGTGRIVHSLRVGFFSAEIAAKAVASYLAQYYDKPAIKRVSFAERERFAEQVIEARKDVGATGRHAVIEITDDLVARRKRFIANAQPASPAP